jgi:hypothetical protein
MIPHNEQEKPPAHMSATTHDPRMWLEHFPPAKKSAVANWFHFSVRSGVSVPAAVLVAVERTVERRLAWHRPGDDWLHMVLEQLRDDRRGAMAYAQSVIAYEQLEPEARKRLKAERTFAALKEVMRGKEVTKAQLAYLQALGYRGAPPADRAQASHLIDQLRQERGRA